MPILPMERSHIPALESLIRLFRSQQNRPLTQQEADQLHSCLEELQEAPQALSLVALRDDRVAGYINAHFNPFPLLRGQECYISDLLVHPEYRGHGIGGALLNEIERLARAKGAKRLMLNNEKEAESYVRSFYSKHGFREREEFANFVKPL